MSGEANYKTHILIGVRSNGAMTVIADWPHVPRQTEVQEKNRRDSRRLRDVRAVYTDVDHCGRRQRSGRSFGSDRSW